MAPLTVTPILYLSNGHRYQLPDVKLEPAGVAVVNVNQALADQGLAPWATLRGYVEVEYKWPWDALCVTVRNVDAVHSLVIAHNLRQAILYSVQSGTEPADHVRAYEGVWWKQEPNVSGFISLSNSSTTPISGRVQVTDNRAGVLGTHVVTVSPHGTKMVNLTELQSTTAEEGGVHITYDGPEDGLLLTGDLEDASVGFSAKLPLNRAPKHATNQEWLTYAAPGLMTGEADPMMRFPAGTRFKPYFVVRNIADHPTSFQPKVYWAENSASHSLSLPQFSIASGATINLDLAGLISASSIKNLNGNINVELDFKGPYGDLLMASGSVDQRNTYVFEVAPQPVTVSVAKGLSYWSTANGDDTMVTLWNPADEAQDFLFTVFFSGGHYKYPIHLGPKATRSFNMSEILEAQTPDADGNIIPAGVREGSAEIAGAEGATQEILAAIDLGIYNVQKATCYPTCIDCNGVVDDWIDADPFGMGVSRKLQETATVQFHDGTKADITNSATWKSSNTGIGTVSTGLVNGVSAGAFDISAGEVLVTQSGEVCQNEPPPQCQRGPVTPGSPGSVVSVSITQRASTGQKTSSGDTAAGEYSTITGTSNLGVQTSTHAGFKACFAGIEFVGSVTPSTYSGSLELRRQLLSCGTYVQGNVPASCGTTPRDDTSSAALRDDDPQPGGTIYDLDPPGVQNGDTFNSVYRYRANFSEYATLADGTTTVSASPVNYYVRVSCKFDANGKPSLDTSVTGDNQVGAGTTKLTWNLQ
jgi:hypothetical protein